MPIIISPPSIIQPTSHSLTSRADDTNIDETLWSSGFYFYFFGIVTLFGGFSAFKAFASTSILAWASKPYLGAYNSPGAYEFAQLLAPLANSPFWDSIFPGDSDDAARILGLEARRTSEFLHTSGTIMRTGHPAYLIARHAGKLHRAAASRFAASRAAASSASKSMVTIIDIVRERPQRASSSSPSSPPSLVHAPPRSISSSPSTPAQKNALREHTRVGVWLIGAFPVYCSCATLVVCIYYHEWWSFASILLGMVAGGFVRFALAPGHLMVTPFQRSELKREERRRKPRRPPSYQPSGHAYVDGGLLLHASRGTIVLRAHEDDLACLTGRFSIDFSSSARRKLQIALTFLTLDVLAQSLLLPQANAGFGLVMFFASTLTSTVFNVYCGKRQEAVQTWYLLDRKLVRGLDESAFKVTLLQSKAGMAVFACLALRHLPGCAPRKLLPELITETDAVPVWQQWMSLVARKLECKEPVEFSELEKRGQGLDEAGSTELAKLLGDAEEAYRTPGWQPGVAGHEVTGDGTIEHDHSGDDNAGDEKEGEESSGADGSGDDGSGDDGSIEDGQGEDGSGEDDHSDASGSGENGRSDENNGGSYDSDNDRSDHSVRSSDGDDSDHDGGAGDNDAGDNVPLMGNALRARNRLDRMFVRGVELLSDTFTNARR